MTDQTTVSGSDAGRQDEQPDSFHRALSTTQAVQGLDAAPAPDPLDRCKQIRGRVAELEAEVERLTAEHNTLLGTGVVDAGDIAWAVQSLDAAAGVALPNDAARLDWLAHREHSFEFCVPGDHVAKKAWLLSVETGQIDRQGKFYDEFDGDTLREAIDAAMKVNAGAQEPRLGWCAHCGEGVTTFCRGALAPCPKGLTQTVAAATPGATT